MATDAEIRALLLDSASLREARERLRALSPQQQISDWIVDEIFLAAAGGDAPDDPLSPDIARARDHLARLT
jgi:hypothetical protein